MGWCIQKNPCCLSEWSFTKKTKTIQNKTKTTNIPIKETNKQTPNWKKTCCWLRFFVATFHDVLSCLVDIRKILKSNLSILKDNLLPHLSPETLRIFNKIQFSNRYRFQTYHEPDHLQYVSIKKAFPFSLVF